MRQKFLLYFGFYIFCCWVSTVNAQYLARITQVDTSNFPLIKAYISLTDLYGNPTTNVSGVNLTVLEEGKSVVDFNIKNKPIKISPVWSVLSLDLSGSMYNNRKLEKAKKAAIAYINLAPSNYQIAIVGFSNQTQIVSQFSAEKRGLRMAIEQLSADGNTAIQDGIATALDLLRGKNDRKTIILLTDGIENNSSAYPGTQGYQQLLQRAERQEVSISVIGLGSDVNEAYLKGYIVTGGWYFFSPSANALHEIFKKVLSLQKKEMIVEYKTSATTPDGTLRKLQVNVNIGAISIPTEMEYVRPGVIPHLRGNHTPYFIGLIILVVIIYIVPFITKILKQAKVRHQAHLQKLKEDSEYIEKQYNNYQNK
jgi:uncharacterized protein YegL